MSSSVRNGVLALLLFVVIGTWMNGVALTGAGRIAGGGSMPDYTGTASFMWWMGMAISHGLNPFHTHWNFFPVGQDFVAQFNLLDALLGAPFLWLLGPEQGYDVFIVLVLATTAMGGFILGRSVGLGTLAATVLGIILETSSFLANELHEGRISQALMVFWLLTLAGLVRLYRGEGGPRLAVLTGLGFVATSLVYWYYGLFLVFAAVPLWLAQVKHWDRSTWKRVVLAGAVGLAGLLPFVVLLASHFRELPGVVRPDMAIGYGDLSRGEIGLSMAIRHSNWLGFGFVRKDLIVGIVNDQRVAILVWALAGVALLRRPWGRLRWGVVALLGYVLSLGPYLHTPDLQKWPLPYLFLYDHLPFFKRFWWPVRLDWLLTVGVAVLAAGQVHRMRIAWGRAGSVVALLIGLGIVVEQAWRAPDVPLPSGACPDVSHAVYDHIDGPVITTPVLGVQAINRQVLWFQMFHKQPIFYGLGAHVQGHRPPGFEDYVDSNGLLLALKGITNGEWPGDWVEPEAVDALLSDGFRWAVVDQQAYPPGLRRIYTDEFSVLFTRLWGEPELRGDSAMGWRMVAITKQEWASHTRVSGLRAAQRVGGRGRQRRRKR